MKTNHGRSKLKVIAVAYYELQCNTIFQFLKTGQKLKNADGKLFTCSVTELEKPLPNNLFHEAEPNTDTRTTWPNT